MRWAEISGRVQSALIRFGWGVADQALSSITNLGLGVAVARSGSSHEFGAFSLAFATYLLAVGASRALTSEPLMVRFSATEPATVRAAVQKSTGAALLVGLTTSICAGMVHLFLREGSEMFLLLAISLPGLLLQDSWRYAFFTWGQGRKAFLNDLVWAGLLFSTLALLTVFGRASVSAFILAWGGSAAVAAMFGMAQAQTLPHLWSSTSWLREQKDLGPRYLTEFASVNGAFQLTMYAVAAVAGVAAAGFLRGGLILLGPVMVLYMGMRLVAIPEAARLLRQSAVRFRQAIRRITVLLALGAAIWGALLLLIPKSLGEALLGASWTGAQKLIPPLITMFVAQGFQVGAFIGLRSLAAARRSLKARLIEGGLTLVAGILGAALGGSVGAAWALAGIFWVESAIWWWFFGRALREVALLSSERPAVPTTESKPEL